MDNPENIGKMLKRRRRTSEHNKENVNLTGINQTKLLTDKQNKPTTQNKSIPTDSWNDIGNIIANMLQPPLTESQMVTEYFVHSTDVDLKLQKSHKEHDDERDAEEFLNMLLTRRNKEPAEPLQTQSQNKPTVNKSGENDVQSKIDKKGSDEENDENIQEFLKILFTPRSKEPDEPLQFTPCQNKVVPNKSGENEIDSRDCDGENDKNAFLEMLLAPKFQNETKNKAKSQSQPGQNCVLTENTLSQEYNLTHASEKDSEEMLLVPKTKNDIVGSEQCPRMECSVNRDTQTEDLEIPLPRLYMQSARSKTISTQTSFETLPTRSSSAGPVPQILAVLSENITVMPDGFKVFNNISSVGTDKWLESALNAMSKFARSKKKFEEAKIVETKNIYDMYVDNDIKTHVQRFRKDSTTILQINKVEKRTISRSATPEMNLPSNGDESEQLSQSQYNLRSAIDEICKNEDLISAQFNANVVDKSKIRLKIHDVFGKLYKALQQNKVPTLVIRNIRNRRACVFKDQRLKCAPLEEALVKKVRFKRNPKFCRFLFTLGKIYTLLENNSKLTKREIYYQVKRLMGNQACVNQCIEDITCLLGIGHWHFNIICYCGLVYGDLKLKWSSGEVTNCNVPGTSIPYDLEDIVEVQTQACFILVVEKESIFHKLLEEDLPNKLARPFLMITGKGMPDINTRLFLHKMATMLSLPVFILVDPDIHGIKIMLTYRFGAIASCHLSDHMAVPNARWLGVFPSEISKYGMKSQILSQHDKKTIISVLKYPFIDGHPRIAEEIQALALYNKKASIEGLIKIDAFLSCSYLPMKFYNKDFI